MFEQLNWLRQQPGGETWLEQLPGRVASLAKRWDLKLGTPYPNSNVSLATPAIQGDRPVVLKVQWPHPECEFEAEALRIWAGNGAVELLHWDPEEHALLLERCDPGTPLWEQDGEAALSVLAELLPRLWRPADRPFRRLDEEAKQWSQNLLPSWEASGKPCAPYLVDAALDFLKNLPEEGPEPVLLHQDLHGLNVLAAQREPWLVIDPKPLVGEREFSLAPIVRSQELGHSKQLVLKRLESLCYDLDLDLPRARGWTIAQTMAWSFGPSPSSCAHQTVEWLLE